MSGKDRTKEAISELRKQKDRLSALKVLELRLQGQQKDAEMQQRYDELRIATTATSTAWNALTEDERIVLDGFYLNRRPGHIQRLQDQLGYGDSNIYRLKRRALNKFIFILFGE